MKDVLQSALSQVGCLLEVQSCNPGCTNLFTHTALHLRVGPHAAVADGPVCEPLSGPSGDVEVTLMAAEDHLEDAIIDLSLGLRVVCGEFAEMKNTGRRLIAIEDAARASLSRLLLHYYQAAAAATLPLVARYKRRWRSRRWRAEAQALLAELWLTLDNIEILKRQWSRLRYEFETDSQPRGMSHLFVADHLADAKEVAELDTRPLMTTVAQIATRPDTRNVILATASAAIGGVTGGVIGATATLL